MIVLLTIFLRPIALRSIVKDVAQRAGFFLLFLFALGILTLMLMGKISPKAPVSPATGLHAFCTVDADCPSPLSCQILEEMEESVVYPDGYTGNITPYQPQRTILKAECRATEGMQCNSDEDCLAELACHQIPSGDKLCTRPVRKDCFGPDDMSCPQGYTCIQRCGPPVYRGDEPPPGYYCEINELVGKQMCPICLAAQTMIATPQGDIPVEQISKDMTVWSLSTTGERIAVPVLQTVRTPVPADHRVMHLVFSDGRIVRVSAGHPLVSGMPVERLHVGAYYDGSRVISNTAVPYQNGATYDILPAGKTRTYWANGILLKSTLE